MWRMNRPAQHQSEQSEAAKEKKTRYCFADLAWLLSTIERGLDPARERASYQEHRKSNQN